MPAIRTRNKKMPVGCRHPPSRYYSWIAYDGTLCVACCDCGHILAGAAEPPTRQTPLTGDKSQAYTHGVRGASQMPTKTPSKPRTQSPAAKSAVPVADTTDTYSPPCCHEALPRRTLAAWRLVRSMTQADLAQRAGVTAFTVSHSESGRHVASLDTALRLAAALGVLVEQVDWGARPQPKRGPKQPQS